MSTLLYERQFSFNPYGMILDKEMMVIQVIPGSQAEALKVRVGWKLISHSRSTNQVVFSQLLPPSIHIHLSDGKNILKISKEAATPAGTQTTVFDLKKDLQLKLPGAPSPSEISIFFRSQFVSDSIALSSLNHNSQPDQPDQLDLHVVFSPTFLSLFPTKSAIFPHSDFPSPAYIEENGFGINSSEPQNSQPAYALELRNCFRPNGEKVSSPAGLKVSRHSEQPAMPPQRLIRIRPLPLDFLTRFAIIFILFADFNPTSVNNAILLLAAVGMYLHYSGILSYVAIRFFPLQIDRLKRLRRRTIRDARRLSQRWVFSISAVRLVVGFFASMMPSWSPEEFV